jgi:hypothetical protein
MARMSDKKVAIADSRSGVSPSEDDMRLELLPAILKSLEGDGYEVVVVVDDDLLVRIEKSDLAEMLRNVTIEHVPNHANSAELLLDIADQAGATVVSNDSFEEYQSRYPWIVQRRIPYRIFQGEVYLDPEELMGVF